MALSEVIDTGRFRSIESDLRLRRIAPTSGRRDFRSGNTGEAVGGAEERVKNFIFLPTRTLLTTEGTENTEENQWHGSIRGANGAGQKQKLCKQACLFFAFFLPIPACWEQSEPIRKFRG